MARTQIPVIGLTGYLGAGKTTLLNHLLRTPGARIGVVVNDFGVINVDAGLITGQVDAAESIAGGCVCCLDDSGGLDQALATLAAPRLRLDAIIIEASGVAEPLALSRLIRFSQAKNVRPGGLIEVVDAANYFDTVDTLEQPPARFEAASLVVLNKIDLLEGSEEDREAALARIAQRIALRNRQVPLVRAQRGAIDPDLVFDVALAQEPRRSAAAGRTAACRPWIAYSPACGGGHRGRAGADFPERADRSARTPAIRGVPAEGNGGGSYRARRKVVGSESHRPADPCGQLSRKRPTGAGGYRCADRRTGGACGAGNGGATAPGGRCGGTAQAATPRAAQRLTQPGSRAGGQEGSRAQGGEIVRRKEVKKKVPQ